MPVAEFIQAPIFQAFTLSRSWCMLLHNTSFVIKKRSYYGPIWYKRVPKLTHIVWRDETEVPKSFLSTSTAFGSSLHLAGLPSGYKIHNTLLQCSWWDKPTLITDFNHTLPSPSANKLCLLPLPPPNCNLHYFHYFLSYLEKNHLDP